MAESPLEQTTNLAALALLASTLREEAKTATSGGSTVEERLALAELLTFPDPGLANLSRVVGDAFSD